MKRKTAIISAIILVLAVMIFVWYRSNTTISIKYPYTQEYIVGQENIIGDVDIAAFLAIDERFEIGANANGYAVFKDPEAAFQALTEKYADGIRLIQRNFDLKPLNYKNYDTYKTYGQQVYSGTEEARSQAAFVSAFLDIFENSFIKK